MQNIRNWGFLNEIFIYLLRGINLNYVIEYLMKTVMLIKNKNSWKGLS